MPNKHSKASRDLYNINQQLRSGQTRGVNPRELRSDEIDTLEQHRDELRTKMREAVSRRLVSRINAHTASVVASEVQGAKREVLTAVNAAKAEIITAVAAQPPQQQAQTFPIDHSAIRTELDRGGLTPAQLLLLHRAAGLQPPTATNSQNRVVVSKAKYLLAECLCRAAGSGEHAVQEGQIFDYHTLSAWIQATRHQRKIEGWQPAVAPSCLAAPAAQPRPKRVRKSGAAATATAAAAPQNSATVLDLLQSKRGVDGSSCSTSTTADGGDHTSTTSSGENPSTAAEGGDHTPTGGNGEAMASTGGSSPEQIPTAETPLNDYDGPRPYLLGQRLSCVYMGGERAGARRTVTVLEYKILPASGYGIRVLEEDGIGREESDYCLARMENVRPLEAASSPSSRTAPRPASHNVSSAMAARRAAIHAAKEF